jgi:hypothetical protein
LYVSIAKIFMKPCTTEDAVNAKRELAEEILRSFGSVRFAATGCSMLPTILPGDTLMVERVSPAAFLVGDIALVGREGRLCAHRVVSLPERQNEFWVTRGDAMLGPDRPVLAGELLGRVIAYIRAGKKVAVSKKLSVVERVLSQFMMRSELASRFFVHIGSRRVRIARESSFACQQ